MKKIIIDCDTGIDDALALLYALKRKDVRIMAITSTFGNCSALQSAINSLKMIELANPGYFIPVYVGSEYTYDGKKTHILHLYMEIMELVMYYCLNLRMNRNKTLLTP